MTGLHFRPEAELWPLIDRAFQEHSRTVRTLVQAAAVEHMGATAVPGSITKGDLDLLVRVPDGDFAAAVESIGSRYVIHQPENWTDSFASFKDDSGEVPVDLQLVVAGSDLDLKFVSLRRLLRDRRDLVERVNELKRLHEDGDPDAYVAAKSELYDRFLREG